MTIALIDYGAGNLGSVANALAAAGAADIRITADPDLVRAADRIVLPGVGAFGACRDALFGIDGMVDAMAEAALAAARPFLGVCVGMQLLADRGEEMGDHAGLGWIGGTVRRLCPADPAARVPHMGWNDVSVPRSHPPRPHTPGRLTIVEPGEAYFLHSYHFDAADPADVVATSDHGGPIVAAVARGSVMGVQFHPEKSQSYGLAMLARFLDWAP